MEMSVNRIFWIIILLLDVVCICFAKRNLKQVHVLYRHGNRSPINSYQSDRYNESVWPQGFSMLTQKGMNQHYELGMWLRERYVNKLGFLKPEYIAKDIIVHSTDTHRTVMSAQSNLAGLFPPSGRQEWNKNLRWQPVGIFTYPSDEDTVLTGHILCPKKDRLVEEKSQPLFDRYLAENKKTVDFVIKNIGITNNNMHSLGEIAEDLYFENEENLTLPNWALEKVDGWNGDYFHWMLMLKNYQTAAIFQDANTELKKLFGGPLIAAMAANFTAVGMNQPSPKLFMYSAHDTNVNSLLSSLDCHNGLIPPPASCVIVELYQDIESNLLTVDILYRNNTDKPPIRLKIGPSGNKCDEQCPLERFLEYARVVTPENFKMECSIHNHITGPTEWNAGWLIFAVVFMMFILLSFTMCVLTVVTACKGTAVKPRNRLQPIDFHLLGTGLSDSEDEAVFDA